MTRRPEPADYYDASSLHRGGARLRAARARVVARDGNRCGRCSGYIDLSLSGLHPDGLTLGHIIPRYHGGTDDDSNLRPEHRRCNLAAGSRRDPPTALIVEPEHLFGFGEAGTRKPR